LETPLLVKKLFPHHPTLPAHILFCIFTKRKTIMAKATKVTVTNGQVHNETIEVFGAREHNLKIN
jgi:hypothetical protein